MEQLERRDFIYKLGKWLLFFFVVTSGGCARLLKWSSRQEVASKKKIKVLKKPETARPREKMEAPPNLVVIKGENPERNIRRALEKMGGIESFVKKGSKVVIKPNLLTAQEPQFAVTTNPLLIGGLVKLCYEAGASEVTVLDRPTGSPTEAYDISGIAEATRRAGGRIKILTDRNFENTLIPQGRILKRWPLVKDVFEADVFINVPIAKTHSLAILTMAMKNLMGIMGGGRSMMHLSFDQKIVDLNTLVRPHLVVLDAHRILVENGPTGGNLADVKLTKTVVVGTSQVSVDAYGTTLFGMQPSDLPYLMKANAQGLGEIDLEKLKIVREEIS